MPAGEAEDSLHTEHERDFRRNLVIVGGLHLLALTIFFFIGRQQPPKPPASVMWLDGGSFGDAAESMEAAPAEPEPAVPEPEPEPLPPEPEPPVPEPPPPPAPAPSEIVLEKATPPPATPKPVTPRPATPKPATPKPSTPKATPKKTTPKATPKASPRKSATPKPSPGTAKKNGTPAAKKSTGATGAEAVKKGGGSGTGVGAGKGAGREGGGPIGSGLDWYYAMLDDRFTSRWEQPLTVVRTGKVVTTLKIRISKDGTIALREIIRSSGNSVVDESVMAAANKVLTVDPPPAGAGNGEFFEVAINFELGD